MPVPEPIAWTEKLTKRYGSLVALSRCTLSVRPGEVLGLLGPNGAGKTTLLRIWAGLIRPSSGTARVANWDCWRHPARVHRHLGYLPGEVRLFRRMSGRAVLELLGRLHPGGNVSAAVALAQRWQLDLSRRVDRASSGMRQKLALAHVCSLDVPLLVLDEPTANLDPDARRQVLEHLRQLRHQGKAVVFSSHVLSEVEQVSDRVAVLYRGELRHLGPLDQLRRSYRIQLRLAARGQGTLQPPPPGECRVQSRGQGSWELEVPRLRPELLRWLASLPVEEVRIQPLALEQLYRRVIQQEEP